MTPDELKYFETEFKFVREQLEEHHTTLYGDGQAPGLKVVVDRLVQTHLLENLSEAKTRGFWVAVFLVGLAGLANLVVAFVK